jgi:hypothetical protein
MTPFACGTCGATVFFDNDACTACGAALAFDPAAMTMRAVPESDPRHCANRGYRVCNWLRQGDAPFCRACALNQTIPDLSLPENVERWRALEAEKRRLVHGLLRLGLPVVPRAAEPETGLAFAFLADTAPTFSERGRVLTGHAAGLITINIAEADPATREAMRDAMDEPYRTLLGHFRHESGHYYWDRLIDGTGWLASFRALFGDEQADYGAALEAHYRYGPPADWAASHVTAYAAGHPWEDWAESWAHYLHMVATLETAAAFGLRVRQPGTAREAGPDFDPCKVRDFDDLLEHWMPLTVALNSLNRSMGHEDAYPFVLAEPVREKLRFIHRVIRG